MDNALPKLAILPRRVLKRDGQQVPFDAAKIEAAIGNAGRATGEVGELEATLLTAQVVKVLAHRYGGTVDQAQDEGRVPDIEGILPQTSIINRQIVNKREQ